MTSAPPLPRSIEGWIKHLDPVRLPIAREQHLRISRALADSRLSLRDIALQMQDCPAIALSLLREANRPRSPLHSPAESLEVALLLPTEIPWEDLAFRSVRFCLEHYLTDCQAGHFGFHEGSLEPLNQAL